MSLPGAADAQSIVSVIDRWQFPALGNEVPILAELDGNPATREYVQFRVNELTGAQEMRGVAARAGLCLGAYFNPFAVAGARALPGDMLLLGFLPSTPGAGGIQRYVVFGVRGYYEVGIGYGCGGPSDAPPPPPPAPPGD